MSMSAIHRSISTFCFVIFIFAGLTIFLPAADFDVDSAGDWENPDSRTLAEALQNPMLDDGSTIILDTNITSGWTNWLAGSGYTIFSAPPLQISGGLLTFDLAGYEISGADLDIVTGNVTFLFQSGTLGTTGTNFGIGVNGDAKVTLHNIDLFAAILQIGSATTQGILTLQGTSTISAASLNVTGDGSLLSLSSGTSGTTVTAVNFSVLDGGTVDSNGGTISAVNLLVKGYGSRLTTNAGAAVSALSVEDGGALTINSGSTFNVSGNLKVSGVGVHEATVGDYYFLQSTLTVDGKLTVDGAILIEKGADADLSSLETFKAKAAQSLTIRNVFFHDLSGKYFQTTVTMDGDLIADDGTISVTGGAILTGVKNITATTDGTVTIDGVFSDKLSGTILQTSVAMGGVLDVDGGIIEITGGAKLIGTKDIFVSVGELLVEGADGEKFRSEIAGSGVLTISGNGTVDVKGGGLIGGRTGITVGDGTLNVSGMNAALMLSSTINSSGELVVGDGAVGTLTIDKGGLVTAGTTTIGQGVDESSVTVAGTGTGDRHSRLTITGDLILSESADASMTISQGGQVTVSGDTYLGNTDGKTATLTLAGRGGTGATDARLNTTGQVIVGNGGNVNLTIDRGGNVTSGKETILGKEATSNVTVSINSDHYRAAWQAGGMPQ
ncbi:MAG: hypothetical protein FWE67_11700, partial [Planctomycetaceae bacterium]|nr:hypothetical protein [Planctomycetaceae bacterium]